MKLQEIKRAITELKPHEIARFRKWFEEFERATKLGTSGKLTDKALFKKRLKEARGSLKGTGALKALIKERRKE